MSIPTSPILDFEKADKIASRDKKERGLDWGRSWEAALEAQAQAAVSPLLSEIERLKGELDTLDDACRLVNERSADAEAEAQKLREALTDVVRLCESAGIRNLANGVELGAMSWLMKMTDAITEARKALGVS